MLSFLQMMVLVLVCLLDLRCGALLAADVAESGHELPCLDRSAKVRGAPLSTPGQEVGLADLLCVHAPDAPGTSERNH